MCMNFNWFRDFAFTHGTSLRKCTQSRTILDQHPKVTWVNYPGLVNNKYHALAENIYLKVKAPS